MHYLYNEVVDKLAQDSCNVYIYIYIYIYILVICFSNVIMGILFPLIKTQWFKGWLIVLVFYKIQKGEENITKRIKLWWFKDLKGLSMETKCDVNTHIDKGQQCS